MYLTKRYDCENDEDFDWQLYFSRKDTTEIVEHQDLRDMLINARNLLQENKFQLVISLNKVMNNLLSRTGLNSPQILELGAATGVLARWLISQYGGNGVLVDKNESSFNAYNSLKDVNKQFITYLKQDIFTLKLEEKYDVVCSFGLIEHFKEKTEILHYHKKFLNENGIVIIGVPMDSKLTRVFFEVHPELNLGYRELLTKKDLTKILNDAHLEVIKTEVSIGYCYDFMIALCRINDQAHY